MSTEVPAVDGAEQPVASVENPDTANAESTTAPEGEAEKQERARDEQGRFQSRINALVGRAGAAERRAAELEAQLAQVHSQRAPVQTDKPPALEQYQSFDEWASAFQQHTQAQARAEAQAQYHQQAQHHSQAQLMQQYAVREQVYAQSHPDYAEAVQSLQMAGLRLDPATVEVIATSEHGPAVLHHLAQHMDEADRIARLPAHRAAYELARIEAKVSAPRTKPVSNAPPPAPKVGGVGSVAPKDPERMSVEEWTVWRNAELRKNR